MARTPENTIPNEYSAYLELAEEVGKKIQVIEQNIKHAEDEVVAITERIRVLIAKHNKAPSKEQAEHKHNLSESLVHKRMAQLAVETLNRQKEQFEASIILLQETHKELRKVLENYESKTIQ